MKEFRKSVNIWWSYGQEFGVFFSDSQYSSADSQWTQKYEVQWEIMSGESVAGNTVWSYYGMRVPIMVRLVAYCCTYDYSGDHQDGMGIWPWQNSASTFSQDKGQATRKDQLISAW